MSIAVRLVIAFAVTDVVVYLLARLLGYGWIDPFLIVVAAIVVVGVLMGVSPTRHLVIGQGRRRHS